MRSVSSAFLACLYCLVTRSSAQISPPPGPGQTTGVDPPPPPTIQPAGQAPSTSSVPASTITTTASLASSTALSSSSSRSPASTSNPITKTTTVSLILSPSPSSSSAQVSTISVSISSGIGGISSNGYTGDSSISSAVTSSTPMSTSESLDSGKNSTEHRNLLIILCSVLGVVGILLIISIFVLVVRYRKGRSPFSHRGASPIDDEEIASWRNTAQEPKLQYPDAAHSPAHSPSHSQEIYSPATIGLAQSPGWTWPSEPMAVYQPPMSQTVPLVPDIPSFLAKAPNSRAGLTDETVPGAEPFIPPMKRQSSRLSKAPPNSHNRTKSRRSSISAKSMWSYREPSMELRRSPKEKTIWFDPDDNVGRDLRDFDRNSDSPGTSIFDDTYAGGLSPRPKSRPRAWEDNKEFRA